MQERKTNHTLLYLACEYMFEVKQLHKERIGSDNRRRIGAREPTHGGIEHGT